MQIMCLLFCGCVVIVNSQSTVETSSRCSNDEYVLQTVERTCRPTQQLLSQLSAKLMNIESIQITTSGMDVEKKHLVSALTGKYVGKLMLVMV